MNKNTEQNKEKNGNVTNVTNAKRYEVIEQKLDAVDEKLNKVLSILETIGFGVACTCTNDGHMMELVKRKVKPFLEQHDIHLESSDIFMLDEGVVVNKEMVAHIMNKLNLDKQLYEAPKVHVVKCAGEDLQKVLKEIFG